MFHGIRSKLARLDLFFVASIIVILSLSLLELYSLAPSLNDGFLLFKKQLFFILIGLLLMFFFSLFDYRFFKEKISGVLLFFLISVGLLGFLLIAGKPIGGSRSWLKIGNFTLEPVELVKITLVLLLAKFFAVRHPDIFLLRHLFTSFLYLLLPLVLVFLQPDFGSAAILFFIWLSFVLISGIKKKHLLITLLIGIIVGGLGWHFLLHNYQRARIISYFNPYRDPLGQGYNIIQSLTAISDGGFWGKGLGGGSIVQLGFLPARHTDFIFASIGEEMGLVGITILLLAYGVLFWRILKISLSTKDNFGQLLSMGTLMLLSAQCFINLGMSIGFLPITGISLPLVSYGGSGMISFLILLGIVLSTKVNK